MKRVFYFPLILVLFSVCIFGQKVAKPTKTPVAPTDAQMQKIREGIQFHDAQNYAQAISLYEAVLKENPDCVLAMYELAISLYQKGDKEKSMEIANMGAQYKSDELSHFYENMASILDDYGKSEEAIKIYQDGLKIMGSDPSFATYRSSLYFNLGVTQTKIKKFTEARTSFKQSIENNKRYSSPNYWLSLIFNTNGYKVPALLSAARFISLEYNTQRSQKAAEVIANVLKPAEKDPKTGNLTVDLNFFAPKDEGDFAMVELMLPTLSAISEEKDKNKTENEKFVDAVDTVIRMAAETKGISSTFVGKNYIPFMTEMKKRGHVEALSYLVRYHTGDKLALKWLQTNDAKVKDFIAWAKAY